MKDDNKKGKHIISVFIKVGSLLTATLGIIVILGWIFDIPQLASFDTDKIPMALSSAVLFVLYGLIIFFHHRLPSNRIISWIGIAFSSVAILVALLLLYLTLNGIRPDAEHLGMKISGGFDGLMAGHMSPITAFIFVFVGLSFLIILMKTRRKKLKRVSFIFEVLVIFISIILLLSYLFGTPLLYEGGFIPPALTTSLSFLFLGITLLLISGLEIWSYEKLLNTLGTRSTHILFLVFVILIVSIITAGYSYYRVYEKHYRTEVEQQLSSIAFLKVNEIVQWRKERLEDAEEFYQNAEFSRLVKQFFNKQNDADAKKRIQEWIEQARSDSEYDQICLHNAKGVEVISSPDGKILSPFIFSARSFEVLKSGQIFFQDFYRDENDKRIYLAIFIPILSDKSSKNVIGVVALRIDPKKFLYPLINIWPLPSKSAETLIVRREGNEVVFLNELKFQKNTALNLRKPLTEINLPAAQAALGKKEITEGVDYRGISVIAYVNPIPNSPWFLVARMDTSEVYESITERLWMLIAIVFVLLLGSAATIGMIWRHQRVRFYNEKYIAEKERASLQEIISKSLNEIYVFDAGTLKFIYVNDSTINNLGYNMEELSNMTPLGIEPRFNMNSFKEMVAPLYEKKIPVLQFETVHQRKDKSEYVVEVHLQLIDSEKGLVFLAVINDITVRKRSEEALRKSEERLRLEMARMPIGYIVWDKDFRVVNWNPAAEKIFGFTASETIGKHPYDLIVPKDAQPLVDAIWSRLLEGDYTAQSVNENFTKAGRTIICDWTNTPFKEADGRVVGVLSMVQDITVRKRAEEEIQKLNAELEQRVLERTAQLENVNKELESFSYSVSHDLRAPLRGIDGFSTMLLEDYSKKLGKKGQRLLNVIRGNTKKMGQLIDDLLSFSRIGKRELDKSEIDMKTLANSIYYELTSELEREKISFTVSNLPNAKGDSSLIRQLWYNIISNAIKFSSRKDNPVIEINSKVENGEEIYFIRDNGVGFDMKYYEKLFGVFQRLHSETEYQGTGVGLAIAKRIVTKHGGNIWAESEINVGTTFYFYL
ncbi:MAG: PAS domain S-box protein [Ignavibacteriales bacterium]|nr:PAS domain S-box protein [Ignavibacteriales bacterium]